MDSLAQMIEETRDVRELKRALSVKLGEGGMATGEIGEFLQVTPRYVRKWRGRYEREGVGALRVGYRGVLSQTLDEDERIYHFRLSTQPRHKTAPPAFGTPGLRSPVALCESRA
jgi:transposase